MTRRFGPGSGMLAAICLIAAFAALGHTQQPAQRKLPKLETPALLIAPFNEKDARTARAAWAQHAGIPAEQKNSLGMELVLIPAGRYSMGRRETADQVLEPFPYATKDWFNGETPYHVVTISKPFYLGKYEVTKGQFSKFVVATSYVTDAERGKGGDGYTGDKRIPYRRSRSYSWRRVGFEQTKDSPVLNVSYNDAVAFCKWLSKQQGKSYRLPTEAEWEYACRAGTTTMYYNGDDVEQLTKIGNVWDLSGKAMVAERINRRNVESNDFCPFTSQVGKFDPNNFGLYDMSGNVWEWCADWFDEKYYAKSPPTDPQGPPGGTDRVRRGGGWNDAPIDCRSAARDFARPDHCDEDLGFRVVCPR